MLYCRIVRAEFPYGTCSRALMKWMHIATPVRLMRTLAEGIMEVCHLILKQSPKKGLVVVVEEFEKILDTSKEYK